MSALAFCPETVTSDGEPNGTETPVAQDELEVVLLGAGVTVLLPPPHPESNVTTQTARMKPIFKVTFRLL